MGQKRKILITDQGNFDLSSYQWDDHRFSDILIKENPIDTNQAMDISKFMREAISKMELHTVFAISRHFYFRITSYFGNNRAIWKRSDQSGPLSGFSRL